MIRLHINDLWAELLHGPGEQPHSKEGFYSQFAILIIEISKRENWHKVVEELSIGRIQMGNKDLMNL